MAWMNQNEIAAKLRAETDKDGTLMAGHNKQSKHFCPMMQQCVCRV